MAKTVLILICLWLISLNSSQAQVGFNHIEFTFHDQSGKIQPKYLTLEIRLSNGGGSTSVYVYADKSGMTDQRKVASLRYQMELADVRPELIEDSLIRLNDKLTDTLFTVDPIVFEDIAATLKKVDSGAMSSALDWNTMHGNSCTIKYGRVPNWFTYQITSPMVKTEERNLVAYMDAIEKILKVCSLNPDDVW